MINKDNFKDLLIALNFKEKGNVFSKYFSDTDAYLKVNFNKNELIYPTDKGFVVNGQFTCNFSSDENFVVFECVHRLLGKGYKPEHIELEPKWKVGHGASGGRADILVKDNSGKSLLIIECKTEGNEFKKEWLYTLQRGGQMLTYAKQAGSTQYVCLYASDFADGKVFSWYNIISLKDNEKLLEELADKKPLSFKEAKGLMVEDIYKAWKETYNLEFATKGIFEDDIQAYQIGKQKYTINDLVEIGSKDIQSKYHEFATIMRQHNVSGRENAFDKLVNLFLCKIVDEAKNPKDLKFNWKGIAYDSYFDLQDRLQLLYQAGMKEFLGEDVTYIDNNSIDKAFRFFKKDPDATRETIKKYFRQLKFFTNNDFAFIDVHNEKLFYQNSEVLLKIVQMLQDTKLRSESQNQFLGDMFEGFLDQGVKQSEGQFFTPMPIVKFILNSLPLEDIIKKSDLPPKAIDYACGAGHFLNELALQIKPFVKQHKETDIKEYYKEIVGIEKEYRLSKVAKVSAFMYGQDDIKIMYADALGKKAKLQDNQYSILVANPPYAVKGFLQTLSEKERKSFTLTSNLDEKSLISNNSIETFFIERAKQLLKPGAVAGIILPASILFEATNLYIKTREIILQYFDIISIVEFGNQTFGKTGQNTVSVFLRRKEENPSPADHWKNRIDSWFTTNEAEVVYNDSYLIDSYCSHIEINVAEYKTLLQSNPSESLLKTETFLEYKKLFDNLSEIKNLKKQKVFSSKPKVDQEAELKKRFLDYIQEVERDKLYFFVLTFENKQKVIVVRCPQDPKEQKKFLGYEWSSAKGSEGIKYLNQSNIKTEIEDSETEEIVQKLSGLHNIVTPLYDPKNFDSGFKINYLIKQNFLGNILDVPENLQQHVSYLRLVDMIDFKLKTFSKQIKLVAKNINPIASKYETIKMDDAFLEIKNGKTVDQIDEEGKYKVSRIETIATGKFDSRAVKWTNDKIKEEDFLKKDDILFSHINSVKHLAKTAVFDLNEKIVHGINLLRFRPNTEKVLPKYAAEILKLDDLTNEIKNQAQKAINQASVNITYLKELRIPYPPRSIQQKIVDECIKIDLESANSELQILETVMEIQAKVAKTFSSGSTKKIKDIIDINQFTKDPTSEPRKEFVYVDIESVGKGTGEIFYEKIVLGANAPSRARRLAPQGSTIISTVRPYLRGFAFIENEVPNCIFSTGFAVLKSKNEKTLLNKIIYYAFMYSTELMKQIETAMPRGSYPSINKDDIDNFTINVPTPKEQEKFVKEVEELEERVRVEKIKIETSADRKRDILKKYL